MKWSKLLIFRIIFAAILAAATTPIAYAATPVICNQPYALCTSARCIPDPENPNKAICDCAVNQGKSIGYQSCKKREPHRGLYNVDYVTSTFSFEQFTTKKSMDCPKGTAWTNCVDMPCTVDPQNAQHAICSCKINNKEAYFTFGGDCDVENCKTGFWSGATKSAGSILRNALNKEVTAVAQTACPIRSKN